MLKAICISLVLACLAGSASANVYNCLVKESGQKSGWVPQQVVVDMRNPEQILVSDTLGMYMMGKPSAGTVVTQSDRSIGLRWMIQNVQNSQARQQAKFQMSASINKTKGTIRVTVKPLGYRNQFHGTGQCQLG